MRQGLASDVCRCALTALVVPGAGALLCHAHSLVFRFYLRGGVDICGLDLWYLLAVVAMAAGIFWVAFRAVAPRSLDTASIAVGLAVSLLVCASMGLDLFADLGLLYAMLTGTYLIGLAVSLRGRAVA